MATTRLRISIFILTTLSLMTAACGTAPDPADSGPAPTPRPSTKPSPTELELSGVYTVEGASEYDAHPYKGTLTITNQDDAYRFTWHTSPSKPGGVGVQIGDALAATYADPAYGKGCGVALYKIGPAGTLDGKIARWGEFTFGSERAVQVEGNNFDGKYKVTGITNDGTAYEGNIEVEKKATGYQFIWRTGSSVSAGYGILRGNRAAISFGGAKCSFALYKVASARLLEGHWGGQRDFAFGTETAKKE